MKPIVAIACGIGMSALVLSGCAKKPESETAGIAPTTSVPADSGSNATPEGGVAATPEQAKPDEIAAVELILSSPESAKAHADKAPEATAIKAAARAQEAAQRANSAPESSIAEAKAYAELSAHAASRIPSSVSAQTAAKSAADAYEQAAASQKSSPGP